MSSNYFPSTGGKPKFNPNADYEAVQEQPTPKGKKPAFNPKKQYEPIRDESQASQPQQPAFQIQISEPTFKGGAGSVGPHMPPRSFTDEKKIHELAELSSAKEAQNRVHSELRSNDKLYDKKIREYRRDSYTLNDLKEEYQKNGWVLPVNTSDVLSKAKQRQYDLPVTQEEIDDIKTGTILDDKSARKFVKELNNKKVQSDLYWVDKYNEISNDPDAKSRIGKVKEIKKKIERGDIVYDPEKKIAIQPLGFVGSIVEGVKNKFKQEEKYDFLKNTENDAAIIKELEDWRDYRDPDEPFKVPKGKAQEFLMNVAEMPIGPMVAGAAGTIGGTFIGNPELGTVAATALGAYENRKIQYARTFEQVYNELRDQDKSKFEALAEARRQANNAQEIGTIVGGAQGLIGANMAKAAIKPSAFGAGYQKAIGEFLKKNGSELGKLVLEGAAQGGIGGAGEIWKNKLAQAAGINRSTTAGVVDEFVSNIMMTAGIGVAIKAGRGISSIDYKRVLSGLKNVPDEVIGNTLHEQVESGMITQKAADETLQRINEYKEKDSQIPANVTEEARFKIQDNIDKIADLESQKESTHKSLQGPIKEKITNLEDENIALSKEVDTAVKPDSGLTKKREKEATEFAEELLIEGVLPDTFESAVKSDPIGFWREIAQQAQNRDADWKPLGEQEAALSEKAVRDQFGDTVVEYAKELFPAPELKESVKSDIGYVDRKNVDVFSDIEGVGLIRGEKAKKNALQRIEGRYGDLNKMANYINDNFVEIERELLSSKVIQKVCP